MEKQLFLYSGFIAQVLHQNLTKQRFRSIHSIWKEKPRAGFVALVRNKYNTITKFINESIMA
jgi:hypothetical protein